MTSPPRSSRPFHPTRVFDVELTDGQPACWPVPGYRQALVLVRFHRRPIAAVQVACPDEVVRREAVLAAVAGNVGAQHAITRDTVRRWLLGDDAGSGAEPAAAAPSWSVVVCTRDRADDLRRCLGALVALETPPGAPLGEIVVVDNASAGDATARVAAEFVREGGAGAPAVRYVREDRPGLNWARSRGARVARGEVVAYTDDDVVVDPGWIAAILEPFAATNVAAVTGLTMPLEIETPAQELFERYGGFGRGFQRREFDPLLFPPIGAGAAGAGANVAFRRSFLVGMRLFEVELDAGTVTLTGGDTYALYRLLAAGYHVVYTPRALVWHRHRRDYAALKRTLYGYSVGGFAYLTRCLVEHGDTSALSNGRQWVWQDHARLLYRALRRRPTALPRDLALAYLKGVAVGPIAYFRSRGRERAYRRADAAAAASAAAASAEVSSDAPAEADGAPTLGVA